jgi:hypothetical protein
LPSAQTWKVGVEYQFCENAPNGVASPSSSLTI